MHWLHLLTDIFIADVFIKNIYFRANLLTRLSILIWNTLGHTQRDSPLKRTILTKNNISVQRWLKILVDSKQRENLKAFMKYGVDVSQKASDVMFKSGRVFPGCLRACPHNIQKYLYFTSQNRMDVKFIIMFSGSVYALCRKKVFIPDIHEYHFQLDELFWQIFYLLRILIQVKNFNCRCQADWRTTISIYLR